MVMTNLTSLCLSAGQEHKQAHERQQCLGHVSGPRVCALNTSGAIVDRTAEVPLLHAWQSCHDPLPSWRS